MISSANARNSIEREHAPPSTDALRCSLVNVSGVDVQVQVNVIVI